MEAMNAIMPMKPNMHTARNIVNQNIQRFNPDWWSRVRISPLRVRRGNGHRTG
jgi:hypothetical protein